MNHLTNLINKADTYEAFREMLEKKGLIIKESDELFLATYPNKVRQNEENVTPGENTNENMCNSQAESSNMSETINETASTDSATATTSTNSDKENAIDENIRKYLFCLLISKNKIPAATRSAESKTSNPVLER